MRTAYNDLVTGVEQVCVVVKDLDATISQYVERAGIGPWAVYTYDAPDLHNTKVRGQPVPFGMRLALAWTGSWMWEVIEPIHGPSIYQEFLDAKGEGMHHVLVRHSCSSLKEVIAEFSRRGCPPAMEGSFKGTNFAYIETEGPLRMTLEVVERPSHKGYTRPEPDYWYPAPPDHSPL